jgi:hypothetical protein
MTLALASTFAFHVSGPQAIRSVFDVLTASESIRLDVPCPQAIRSVSAVPARQRSY